jgi:hypothetical protein
MEWRAEEMQIRAALATPAEPSDREFDLIAQGYITRDYDDSQRALRARALDDKMLAGRS